MRTTRDSSGMTIFMVHRLTQPPEGQSCFCRGSAGCGRNVRASGVSDGPGDRSRPGPSLAPLAPRPPSMFSERIGLSQAGSGKMLCSRSPDEEIMLDFLKKLFRGRTAEEPQGGQAVRQPRAGRSRAEESLRQSEEHFEQLVAGVRDYAI